MLSRQTIFGFLCSIVLYKMDGGTKPVFHIFKLIGGFMAFRRRGGEGPLL